MQEYVNELAQALVDTDKNSQDAVAGEKIKRLVNEAVSQIKYQVTDELPISLPLNKLLPCSVQLELQSTLT